MGANNRYSQSRRFEESLQLPNTSWVPHFAQGFCFDLTDALAGNLELPAYLLQRATVSIDQPKPLLEHLPFPVRERLQHVFDFFLQQHNGRHVAWVFCPSVLDEVAKIGFFALAHWRLERDRLLRHFQDRSNAINWQEHFFSHLFGRRLSPVFLHMSLLMVSIMCTGIRIVRAWSAIERVMA